jgi:hypothetical protein
MSKKNFINTVHLEGYLYEHNLKSKVSAKNIPYISGDISIATDDTNIVTVHYTYVAEYYPQKNPNDAPRVNGNYAILQSILDGTTKTVMGAGKENAAKLRVDSAIALNEWYNYRVEGEPLVSTKRNEGGFIHPIDTFSEPDSRSTFEADMVITNFSRKETEDQPDTGIVKGCIFGYPKMLLPVEFTVTNPAAIDYFEGLEATQKQPVFTKVKGQEISRVVKKKIEEASAWGEISVREVTNTQKAFVITWAQPEPYLWDDESTLLASELSEMIAAREIHLAEIKQRSDTYRANKNSTPSAFAKPTEGEYKF